MFGWLMLFGPRAPISTEFGACEAGAVRDVMAGNFILPSYDPSASFRPPPHYLRSMPREGEWGPGGMVQVPPLYWWLAALGARLLGTGALPLRLPSIAAAAITCALVYAWAAAVLGQAVALWAVLIVVACQYFIDAAAAPRMDMLLTMFVTGACFALERALASEGRRRKVMLAAAALCIGLGSLAKGPLGALLPALVFGAYLLLRGRLRELFRAGPLLVFGGGFCLWLVWFTFAYAVGGSDFFHYQIVEGLLRRALPDALGGAGSCRYPPYEYVQMIMGRCLPWSLFIPSLAALLIKRRDLTPEPVLFCLFFFVAVFGFFTLSSGRCQVYVLPCVAPLAVMLAYLLVEMVRRRPALPRTAVILFDAASGLTGIAILLVAVFAIVAARYGIPPGISERLRHGDRRLLVMVAGLISGHRLAFHTWLGVTSIGAMAAFAGIIRSQARWSAGGVLAIAAISAFFWYHALAPEYSARVSFRGFAGEVDALVPPGMVLEYLVREPPCDLRFYLVHDVEPGTTVDADPDRGFFLLRQDDLDRLSLPERSGLSVLARSTNASPNLLTEVLVEKRASRSDFPAPARRDFLVGAAGRLEPAAVAPRAVRDGCGLAGGACRPGTAGNPPYNSAALAPDDVPHVVR